MFENSEKLYAALLCWIDLMGALIFDILGKVAYGNL